MKLEGIRNKIDKIDRELLVLLQERMGLALRSRKFQESAGDSKQEEDTLERMKRLNLDLVKSSFSRQLLKTIIITATARARSTPPNCSILTCSQNTPTPIRPAP